MLDFFPMQFYTKRENNVRFFYGRSDHRLVVVRQVYDQTGSAIVEYLREANGARSECAAVGQREYEPALDIDRYLVECSFVKGQVDRCAVFELVKASVENKRSEAVGHEGDSIDAHGAALIRGGDGYMGVVASMPNAECSFLPSHAELEAVCKNCVYRRNGTCDDGKSRESDFERSHGGIISYFRRLAEKVGL